MGHVLEEFFRIRGVGGDNNIVFPSSNSATITTGRRSIECPMAQVVPPDVGCKNQFDVAQPALNVSTQEIHRDPKIIGLRDEKSQHQRCQWQQVFPNRVEKIESLQQCGRECCRVFCLQNMSIPTRMPPNLPVSKDRSSQHTAHTKGRHHFPARISHCIGKDTGIPLLPKPYPGGNVSVDDYPAVDAENLVQHNVNYFVVDSSLLLEIFDGRGRIWVSGWLLALRQERKILVSLPTTTIGTGTDGKNTACINRYRAQKIKQDQTTTTVD
mmetsp:Transcript_27516/g.60546  ORF Transcript_27516/g.60546 Transcript_27516/m.60546 type:complete len:269 (+) Transcript_27516:1090-1896(+)